MKPHLVAIHPVTSFGKRQLEKARELDMAKVEFPTKLPRFYKNSGPKFWASLSMTFLGGVPWVLFGQAAETARDASMVLFWFGLSLALTGMGLMTILHEGERVQVENSMCMPV